MRFQLPHSAFRSSTSSCVGNHQHVAVQEDGPRIFGEDRVFSKDHLPTSPMSPSLWEVLESTVRTARKGDFKRPLSMADTPRDLAAPENSRKRQKLDEGGYVKISEVEDVATSLLDSDLSGSYSRIPANNSLFVFRQVMSPELSGPWEACSSITNISAVCYTMPTVRPSAPV